MYLRLLQTGLITKHTHYFVFRIIAHYIVDRAGPVNINDIIPGCFRKAKITVQDWVHKLSNRLSVRDSETQVYYMSMTRSDGLRGLDEICFIISVRTQGTGKALVDLNLERFEWESLAVHGQTAVGG